MERTIGVFDRAQHPTADDAYLLSLVQSGDEQAMATLFDRYSRIVYSVALRVLSDPALAEDILQEVFMQLWRTPGSFTAAEGNLGGWLAVLSRNRSIDAIRRKHHATRSVRSPSPHPPISATRPSATALPSAPAASSISYPTSSARRLRWPSSTDSPTPRLPRSPATQWPPSHPHCAERYWP